MNRRRRLYSLAGHIVSRETASLPMGTRHLDTLDRADPNSNVTRDLPDPAIATVQRGLDLSFGR
jgi:hypothetical protein